MNSINLSACNLTKKLLLNSSNTFTSAVAESFDADSFQLMIDSDISSTATPCEDYSVKGNGKHMHGLTIYCIVLGIQASSVGSVSHDIKDDDSDLNELQIDRALHFEKLPSRLKIPEQKL